MRRVIRQRRGLAALLAMLYMILFSTLAIGFYAVTTTGVQVVANEKRTSTAMLAAESGMEMIRYHLAQVVVGRDVPEAEIMNTIYTGLSDALDGTGNMSGNTVGMPDSNTVSIPVEANQYITCDDSGARFRATIAKSGMRLLVTVEGRHGDLSVTRTIRLGYQLRAIENAVFQFGVAALGKIELGDEFDLTGDEDAGIGRDIYSHNIDEKKEPIKIKKKATINGEVYLRQSDAKVKLDKDVRIGGIRGDDPAVQTKIHRGYADGPEFPTIDRSEFEQFATTTYSKKLFHPTKKETYYAVNTRIPRNTNPKFDKKTVFEGVVMIEMPNEVVFEKETEVRGIIVVIPSSNPKDYKDEKNKIEFKSGADLYGIETLPVNASFPQEMHDLGGASIIAPDTKVKFSGKSGAWGGTIIAKDLEFSGHSGGKITGSIISYGDVKLKGKSSLNLKPPANWSPAGLRFTSIYVPDPSTYEEVSSP